MNTHYHYPPNVPPPPFPYPPPGYPQYPYPPPPSPTFRAKKHGGFSWKAGLKFAQEMEKWALDRKKAEEEQKKKDKEKAPDGPKPKTYGLSHMVLAVLLAGPFVGIGYWVILSSVFGSLSKLVGK